MSQLVKAAMTSGIVEAVGVLKARHKTQSEAVDEATGCGVVVDGMLRCRQTDHGVICLGRAGTVGRDDGWREEAAGSSVKPTSTRWCAVVVLKGLWRQWTQQVLKRRRDGEEC